MKSIIKKIGIPKFTLSWVSRLVYNEKPREDDDYIESSENLELKDFVGKYFEFTKWANQGKVFVFKESEKNTGEYILFCNNKSPDKKMVIEVRTISQWENKKKSFWLTEVSAQNYKGFEKESNQIETIDEKIARVSSKEKKLLEDHKKDINPDFLELNPVNQVIKLVFKFNINKIRSRVDWENDVQWITWLKHLEWFGIDNNISLSLSNLKTIIWNKPEFYLLNAQKQWCKVIQEEGILKTVFDDKKYEIESYNTGIIKLIHDRRKEDMPVENERRADIIIKEKVGKELVSQWQGSFQLQITEVDLNKPQEFTGEVQETVASVDKDKTKASVLDVIKDVRDNIDFIDEEISKLMSDYSEDDKNKDLLDELSEIESKLKENFEKARTFSDIDLDGFDLSSRLDKESDILVVREKLEEAAKKVEMINQHKAEAKVRINEFMINIQQAWQKINQRLGETKIKRAKIKARLHILSLKSNLEEEVMLEWNNNPITVEEATAYYNKILSEVESEIISIMSQRDEFEKRVKLIKTEFKENISSAQLIEKNSETKKEKKIEKKKEGNFIDRYLQKWDVFWDKWHDFWDADND